MFYSLRHLQSRGSATAMAEESFPNLTGVFSVVPTPFDAEGNVDLPSLRRVVDLYIGAGVDGLTALGVTSETASLDDRERALILGTGLPPGAHRLRSASRPHDQARRPTDPSQGGPHPGAVGRRPAADPRRPWRGLPSRGAHGRRRRGEDGGCLPRRGWF